MPEEQHTFRSLGKAGRARRQQHLAAPGVVPEERLHRIQEVVSEHNLHSDDPQIVLSTEIDI